MAKAIKASNAMPSKMQPVALSSNPVSSVQQAFRNIDLQNHYQVVSTALSGVYADTFIKFVDLVNISRNELAAAMNISTKTIKNKLADKEPLDPNQGEHLLKIISLFELGEKIFGGLEPFKRWLEKPFFGKSQKPEDFMKTTGGVELIIDELKRVAYGDVI
jgi:putative toxin-antitoxin system antitoxin component (TIGR02293 family)